MKIHITHEAVKVTKLTGLNASLDLSIEGQNYSLDATESITIPLAGRGGFR
ncbi:hypothetical protein D3C76_1594560 [compost metagenome]